jgi:hypothetical protein
LPQWRDAMSAMWVFFITSSTRPRTSRDGTPLMRATKET